MRSVRNKAPVMFSTGIRNKNNFFENGDTNGTSDTTFTEQRLQLYHLCITVALLHTIKLYESEFLCLENRKAEKTL